MMRTFSFLLLVWYARLQAQTPGPFTVISANEGLSQGMVFDILQSKDDNIWIATKNCINSFDGYRFELYAPDLLSNTTCNSPSKTSVGHA